VYNKECKIPGIREIDTVVEKVQKSKDRLANIQYIIDDIKVLG